MGRGFESLLAYQLSGRRRLERFLYVVGVVQLAEHWIVVSGTAEVTNGDEVSLFSEGQGTYIPLGAVHRLKNPGVIPLVLIEVQSGPYTGEDDIVRLADVYGRS